MNAIDKSKAPIGIFDSGSGGFTVAKAIEKLLPNEHLVYFGDTLHFPYGEKSKEAIVLYSTQIAKFLVDAQHCKMVVIACNSATANALEEVSKAINPITCINVIDPVVNFIKQKKLNNIGVIGTRATVNSGIYQHKIQQNMPHAKVQALATPLLAPIVEESLANTPLSKAAINHYLSEKILDNIDSIILACTHYPVLSKEIQAYYQGRVEVIDTAHIVAQAVAQELKNQHLINLGKDKPNYTFYVSDLTKHFAENVALFFGKNVPLLETRLA